MYYKLMKIVLGVIVALLLFFWYHLVQEYTDIITPENAHHLDQIIFTVIAILVAVFWSNVLGMLVNTNFSVFKNIPPRLAPVSEALAKYGVWFVALSFILQLWGSSTEKLLGALGIIGIGVAFAAQTTLQNLFGFASIIITNPFKEGDTITVGDATGTVVGIRPFDSVLQDGNKTVTIPNSTFLSVAITRESETDGEVHS